MRNNTSVGLVPQYLAANGVSAGTQLATSASTVVLFTVLKALEQSVMTGQLPVESSVRALSPTCSTPPRTATPDCLTSRLASSTRDRHCRMVLAVMSLVHVMPTQTGRLFPPDTVSLDCEKSCRNSVGTRPVRR